MLGKLISTAFPPSRFIIYKGKFFKIKKYFENFEKIYLRYRLVTNKFTRLEKVVNKRLIPKTNLVNNINLNLKFSISCKENSKSDL